MLARAVYAEMVLAGITAVGEFHYLHHGPDGKPYRDSNAMGYALITAAGEAGLRITLLDTLYLDFHCGRPRSRRHSAPILRRRSGRVVRSYRAVAIP